MVTKKTTKSRKRTTAKKTGAVKPSENVVERPSAACPFPEHLQVDLESAQTELMKSQTPLGAPLPIFSTRALSHGIEAAGAAGLRKGFSWNSQMDLAWALGYPEMTFIVDGMLEDTSKEAMLAYYGATLADLALQKRFSYFTGGSFCRLFPRRAAFARLYEVQHHPNHPFDLSDEEFLEVTEPRELSGSEIDTLLRSLHFTEVEDIALLLEALEGTSMVAEALVKWLEELPKESEDNDTGKYRVRIAGLLKAMSRRLPPSEAAALFERTSKLSPWARDPRTLGLEALAKGWLDDAIDDLQWVDGFEEDVLRSFMEASKDGVGDVPFPRYLYAGGDDLVQAQSTLFKKYSDGPVVFFKEYSTIQHPLLTGPALLACKDRSFRDAMILWFQRHTNIVRPWLEQVEESDPQYKRAQQVLKKL